MLEPMSLNDQVLGNSMLFLTFITIFLLLKWTVGKNQSKFIGGVAWVFGAFAFVSGIRLAFSLYALMQVS